MRSSIELCPFCKSKNTKLYIGDCEDYEYQVCYRGGIFLCRKCNLQFISPKPLIKDLSLFYPESYANYSKSNSLLTRILMFAYEQMSLKGVMNLLGKKGKILDVGCADGNFLDILKKANCFELFGTEITQEAAQKAIDKGYHVYVGELENMDIKEDSFDLIRLNHILEHVLDPFLCLSKIKKLLKPGGYLIVETPNTVCLDFYLFRRFWGALHFPRHIHLFEPKLISKMAEKVGLKVQKEVHTIMPTGWSLSIQNYLVSKFGFRMKNGRICIYPLLMILFAPITIVQKMFKRSTMVRYIIVNEK